MKELLKGWVGLYFSILLMEKMKQSTGKWLSQVMTSEGRVKWLVPSWSQGWKWRQTWPISPTVVVPPISVKTHFYVNASLDVYSLKITPSLLALSHSFLISTHLHAISRLEKRVNTNQPIKISRAEYKVFLFILLIVVYSQSGKSACREV